MAGVEIRAAAARIGFFKNIITITAINVIASGMNVVTQFDSTSFRELISPMIRDKIFPVGLESKNLKSSV